MELTPSTTLCFSGHRSYTGHPDDEERLAAALQAAWEEGYRTFVSGMAVGFDLAAARAVAALRERRPDVRLVAAVPFAGHHARFGTRDRELHERLIAAADHTCVLAEGYSRGCFYRRDDWMVDRSSRIVCWYDGSAGGTRYTVRRAVAAGLQVVNLFRRTDTLF